MPHVPPALRRRIPGIGWRDRKIAFLETRVDQLAASRQELQDLLSAARTSIRERLQQSHAEKARLREELQETQRRLEAAEEDRARYRRSSFKAKLSSHIAAVNTAKFSGWQATSPATQLPFKLRSYALAQSHGVRIPTVHRVWERAEDIRLEDDLGSADGVDHFVLKADGGHSGLAVVPLRRTAHGWETLTGHRASKDGVLEAPVMRRLDRARGPFFLESFLQPESASGSAPGAVADGVPDAEVRIPEDIKVYTAYGEILQVLVMRTQGVEIMDRKSFTRRYFDAQARCLGEVLPGAAYDDTITAPRQWADLMAAARRLSVAVGTPFVRVDLYATQDGPVLGELTPTPGGAQEYLLDHDLALGAAWMRAEVRLSRDIARGRPAGTLFGPQEYTWWYPEVDADARDSAEPQGPSTWPRLQAEAQKHFTAPEETGQRHTLEESQGSIVDGVPAPHQDAATPSALSPR
ncbi:ATP-grasp fold amidoligase family protein [Nesterenkonia xinjiangensis]|uniref:Teichuronopeptide biosynthesis TupA-like protein n=1 Tax=Nesterenkonia xinjiangensis TaxID=225327 RepID=A0A7Z0GQ99_9MICC|nr:ATP-grasp fold amidoligase family protein [Nesterenkonia xinjiangensis]NYJ79719.1 hypothetical protein [Nesterenkonia xinjiangensis]